MAMKLSDTQRWQRNLASLIRSGLLTKAEISESNGLFTVHGVYTDGSHSAAVAKYGDIRRAEDAADTVNYLARSSPPIEMN
jgi:hypothetical protein